MTTHHGDLVRTMQELYASEINCGLSSFWDGSFQVWLGDDMNGKRATMDFDAADLPAAARWLHEAALKHFAHSDYAERWAAQIA